MDEPADDSQHPKRRPRRKRKAKPRKGKTRGIHIVRKNDKQPFKYNAKPIIELHKAMMGRPTEYTPLRGMELLGHMASGLSVTAASAAMGFCPDTIYEWARRHPDFSESLKSAKAARTLYYERKLNGCVDGPAVTAAIFGLKNCAPDEWRDKHVIEARTADDDPLLAFLKSIDGRVMRPVEPPTIDGTCVDVTTVTRVAPQIDGPPRPIGGP